MRAEAGLTQRETQIAELLAWGAAKKEVADRLSISPRTVENTARNIYSKIRNTEGYGALRMVVLHTLRRFLRPIPYKTDNYSLLLPCDYSTA